MNDRYISQGIGSKLPRNRRLSFELSAIVLCVVLGASCMKERLTLTYDGFEFYEAAYGSCTHGSIGEQGLKQIFLSLDGGPAKHLSDFSWDDFCPREKLMINGDSKKGQITCGGTFVVFRDGKPVAALLHESPGMRIRIGAAASGPFISLPATPSQIKAIFGKPMSIRPTP